MPLNHSLIESEIDFERDGKQCGFLRLPHSVHRSAYGWLPVPVVYFKNGEGPGALLMAGNHGDEYEGQVTLCKLVKRLQASDVTGRLIILPMANYPAAHAGLRTSPIDAGNLNRSFPGDPAGTPTMMMAHYIEEELFPRCDFMMDLHSGGSSLMYIPSVQAQFDADGSLNPRTRELVEAFAAPVTQVYAAGSETRMAEEGARRKGLLYFITELGGTGTVTPEALAIAEAGVYRTLHTFGILAEPGPDVPPAPQTRYLEVAGSEHYCYAREEGIFEPLVALGDTVKPGDPAAMVHFPETPWRESAEERFGGDGVVICKRIPGRVQRGDCLFHLGRDWQG